MASAGRGQLMDTVVAVVAIVAGALVVVLISAAIDLIAAYLWRQ